MDSLKAFLADAASRDHALGRLLRESNASRGLVHTPREIAQQPWLWRETAARIRKHASALRDFLGLWGLFNGQRRPAIVLTGAGTSDYVGISLLDLFRRAFRVPIYNWPTTRIAAFPNAYFQESEEYLLVHFARSGDSPESRAVLELGLRHFPHSMRHVVITCNPAGALARLAREHRDKVYLVVLHEGSNDRGLAMTSSFTNMVVAGQALTYLDTMDEFIPLIDRVASAGTYLIDVHADTIFDLAEPELKRAFYLGNVDQLGAAVESALKTQELTAGSITAMGEDTLAFRHGPIAAVDPSSMVCFYISANQYTSRYEIDVLNQFLPSFREMGARTVVVGDAGVTGLAGGDSRVISYDPHGEWALPSFHQVNVSVLFGQMFGLFASYRRGLNVDDPGLENALYSRTVQGVRLFDFRPEPPDELY